MNDNQRQQQLITLRRKAMWIMVAISLITALILGGLRYGEIAVSEQLWRNMMMVMMSTGMAAVVFMVMLTYVLRGWLWALVMLVCSFMVPVVAVIGIGFMNFQASVRLRQLREQEAARIAALAAADDE